MFTLAGSWRPEGTVYESWLFGKCFLKEKKKKKGKCFLISYLCFRGMKLLELLCIKMRFNHLHFVVVVIFY